MDAAECQEWALQHPGHRPDEVMGRKRQSNQMLACGSVGVMNQLRKARTSVPRVGETLGKGTHPLADQSCRPTYGPRARGVDVHRPALGAPRREIFPTIFCASALAETAVCNTTPEGRSQTLQSLLRIVACARHTGIRTGHMFHVKHAWFRRDRARSPNQVARGNTHTRKLASLG
jgi:hypothetical protein